MTSGPLQRSVKEIATSHPEVEFALVLARTIDSVASDPQQLRSAVYELARQKLQQLAHDDPVEKERLMQALEVAIEGVEAHTKSNPVEKFPVPSTTRYLQAARPEASTAMIDGPMPYEAAARPAFGSSLGSDDLFNTRANEPRPRSKWSSSTPLRYLAMLAFFAAVAAVIVLQQRGVGIGSLRTSIAHFWPAPRLEAPKATEVARNPQPVAIPDPEPKKSSLLPTAYGVYAESGGKLHELQMLQGRAPDPRVAISAAITKPSETLLPDGHLRFIVFRREGASGASDPIEVRVIARVRQATTFDAAGKPVVSPTSEETWVIRNISLPYRAAPLKEDPQMYEVQARDPEATLSPGRYVLVLKSQAYDFTVAGTATDKRQCLQRLTAANGVFYSECEKP